MKLIDILKAGGYNPHRDARGRFSSGADTPGTPAMTKRDLRTQGRFMDELTAFADKAEINAAEQSPEYAAWGKDLVGKMKGHLKRARAAHSRGQDAWHKGLGEAASMEYYLNRLTFLPLPPEYRTPRDPTQRQIRGRKP